MSGVLHFKGWEERSGTICLVLGKQAFLPLKSQFLWCLLVSGVHLLEQVSRQVLWADFSFGKENFRRILSVQFYSQLWAEGQKSCLWWWCFLQSVARWGPVHVPFGQLAHFCWGWQWSGRLESKTKTFQAQVEGWRGAKPLGFGCCKLSDFLIKNLMLM